MVRRLHYYQKGFTLVELLVAVSLTIVVLFFVVTLLIQSFRGNRIIWDQLESQHDGRQVVHRITDVVRKAQEGSNGAYPVVLADTYELTVYANVDDDTVRERVRFWLDGTDVYEGVVNPTGNPLAYDDNDEETTVIGRYVVNIAEGTPLFQYYDEGGLSTSTPLAVPADVTAVHVVRVSLEIEKDPEATPEPLYVESIAQIRNLKTN